MSTEQEDYFKSIIGDGLGEVELCRDISRKHFGNGGELRIVLRCKCDQSSSGYSSAVFGLDKLLSSLLNAYWPNTFTDIKNKMNDSDFARKDI